MCDSGHRHHHGAFEPGKFGRFKPVGRRSFLAGVGKGTFALLTEVSVARNVIAIAIGSTAMAACAAPPAATSAPTTAESATAATESPTAAPTEQITATAEPTVAPTAAATLAATSIALPPASYNQVNLGFVNAYVLVRGNEVAVVDTGVAGSQGKIEEVIKTAGRAWGDVRHVILTHYHQDHIGSMDAVMAASTNAIAYAGPLDIPQIKVSVPLQGVTDGQEIFGLQVVYTPGHTPGHISIYDPAGSALITGDALSNGGTLSGPNPQFTADMAMANESVKKLAQLNFEKAYFMHGNTIDAGASKALAELAATLQ